MNEQLSAFLDGEASRDEADSVVGALLRDDALRDSWSRQHWIRTTLRAHSSEVAVAPDIGFSRRVMARVAADGHHETVSAISVAQPRASRARPARWRGVAGLGMAAAVAGIVLMSGNPFLRSSGNGQARVASAESNGTSTRRSDEAAGDVASQNADGVGGWNDRLADFSTMQARSAGMHQAVASMGSAIGVNSADASPMPTAARSDAGHWSVSDPAVRDELNGYLVDHNGMARSYGMSSTTPAYVRVAAYGQGAPQ